MLNFLDVLKLIHNAGIIENYAVLFMIIYLTDVWGLGIAHAAGLINIWVGITKILPLVHLFLMDNYIGSYSMLLISTTASTLGMGLLSTSTPSWLYSLITGSCSEYKMECITETQQSYFYFALVLIMIARSTRDATIETLNFKGDANEVEWRQLFVKSGSDYALGQATLLLLTPWSIIFGVSSAYSSMALFLLMDKSWSHKLYINNPERSPVTGVLKVFVASVSKIAQDIKRVGLSISRITTFRFIDTVATRPNDEVMQNAWTFISLQEVDHTKILLRMLPLGVPYIFLVLIATTCSTYFILQAKRLKSISFFGIEFIYVSYLALMYLFEQVRNKFKYNNTYNNKETLHTAVINVMINAMMCCVIAALVEKSGVLRNHGLANKPGDITPMSTLWLFPQFIMLGYLNASLDKIIRIFFYEDMPYHMLNFKVFVFEGFTGIAAMSSVLVVYLVGKISERGGQPNWFQHDTENSRLDMFYWTLTLLCVLVSTIWFLVYRYINKRSNPKFQQPRVSA